MVIAELRRHELEIKSPVPRFRRETIDPIKFNKVGLGNLCEIVLQLKYRAGGPKTIGETLKKRGETSDFDGRYGRGVKQGVATG
jgi:hypothetical protein